MWPRHLCMSAGTQFKVKGGGYSLKMTLPSCVSNKRNVLMPVENPSDRSPAVPQPQVDVVPY